MATSNPASISRFAEIGRQEIFREAQRERLALEAVKSGVREVELDAAGAAAVPVLPAIGEAQPVGGAVRLALARARSVVLGRLGRRLPSLGRP